MPDCPGPLAGDADTERVLDLSFHGSRWLGRFASNYGDRTIIDGWVVNGSAKLVGFVSREFRRIQSGYVYHYAFVMIVGVFGLLYWWDVR